MDSNLDTLVAETLVGLSISLSVNLNPHYVPRMKDPATIGCLFANRQGLCIEAKGIANPQSAGILVALSEQAAKLDPNCNPPTVILEYDDMLVNFDYQPLKSAELYNFFLSVIATFISTE